jgi:hypothetical protein
MKSLAALTVVLVCAAAQWVSAASDFSGRVLFNGLPVPGATITATHSGKALTTSSDEDGAFRFAALDDGKWSIRVEMRGFTANSREAALPLTELAAESSTFTLVLQSYEETVGRAPSDVPPPPPIVSPKPPESLDAAAKADTPDIINGSVINGAASRFAQSRAFGNNRPNIRPRYSGVFGAALGNSAWNAQPYAFSGGTAPIPSYNDANLQVALNGPLRIPWLLKNGPISSVSYQHNVNHNATTQSALMPTLADRAGGGFISAGQISPQAAALLQHFPLPNMPLTNGANYQTAVTTATTQDVGQFGTNKNVSNRTSIGLSLLYRRSVTDSVNLFNFADSSRQSSFTTNTSWTKRFSTRVQMRATYQFTRAVSTVTPFFASRTNVSGDAGIAGNSQDAANWGPPTLSFPDVADLRDAQYQHSTTNTHAAGAEMLLKKGRHNLTFGGNVSHVRFDVDSQPDPRGTLAFTGAATGNAFADFLFGVPATSAIAFGNTDARLRENTFDAYANDDFRLSAGVTMNAGLRWEYDAPFTEASGHLLTALKPDRRGLEPRVGFAWRPVLGSSLVIRANYGLYRNLGGYQSIGLMLAQQPPYAKSFSVQNGPATRLTLANPFPSTIPATKTFDVDPNFRPGYAHSWTFSMQRDLPASLTVIAAYSGDRGTHLMQASLPNTYPAGVANPCPSCPTGFVFLSSSGRSNRNAGQLTIRRRLYAGFTATVQYTLSKSTDDAATFSNTSVSPAGLAIAQNWLDLGAERGPSNFDQRHLLSVQAQYTTGVGVVGGTLIDGFWGTLYKDWTISAQLTAGSGMPFTPVFFSAVSGTSIVGVRPSLTGVSVKPVDAHSYANAAAFTSPAPGTWGDAGRNSLRGPAQFAFDATLERTFKLRGRLSLDYKIAATNLLNRVTFATINTVITSPQFGLPTIANQMRRVQMTFRLRF